MHMIKRLVALGQKRAIRLGYYFALACIIILSLLPQSGGQGFAHADKIMHFLLFLIVTLIGRLTHQNVAAIYLAAALLSYGMLMEMLQGMTTWRMASAGDLLADAIGILAGTVLGARLLRSERSL